MQLNVVLANYFISFGSLCIYISGPIVAHAGVSHGATDREEECIKEKR